MKKFRFLQTHYSNCQAEKFFRLQFDELEFFRMNYFVTAIDTDSGKTLASAILCEAFSADYWKPIQAGLPRDSDVIRELVSNSKTFVHEETYLLNTPASPHAAAKIDGIEITLDKFSIPQTDNDLIIEGAGGCLVPLNETNFVADLITKFNLKTIVVADLYLGSINHTLLTIEELKRRNVFIAGIIFNGTPNPESQRIITSHTNLRTILHIKKENSITKEVVRKYAEVLKSIWHE
jgi:dethiobiotin synthetase